MTENLADASTLAPMSKERLQTALDTLEVNHGTDKDGDIIAQFDDNLFWFMTVGDHQEIFHVRASWKAWLPGERRLEALEFVNDWNRSHFFPSVSLHVDSENDVQLQAIRNSDMEFGATDAQLIQEIRSAVAPSLQFFAKLEEHFPGSVAAAEAYRASRG